MQFWLKKGTSYEEKILFWIFLAYLSTFFEKMSEALDKKPFPR